MSLEVVGGLAGISGPYLSMLERGLRGFHRRGLIEGLADALGCSVADLTGQLYLTVDRQSAEVAVVLAELGTALYDVTLEDVPDIPARSIVGLASAAALALGCVDDAGYGLAAVFVELHVQTVTGDSGTRRAALTALVEVCRYEVANLLYAVNGWELANLELYAMAGLTLELATEREVPIPGLTATIDGDRISISFKAYGKNLDRWDVPLTAEVAAAVRARGSILLGLTTLIDLREKCAHAEFVQAKVRLLIRHHQIALGTAALARRRWPWRRL